jgi:isoquinoline 1-oxidoreductase beta subunit
MAAKVLGIEPAKVEVTTTYAGGSFGRRASKHSDFVVEAAELAKVLKKPVHLMWTREDDTRGGYYRPLTLHRAEVGFDAKKNISGWKHSIVGQSVVGDSFFEAMMIKDGVDSTMVEGVADSRYSIADFSVDCHLKKQAVSVLWWRSVGHTHTAYVMETLMDEVAEKSKRDPLQLRRQLLKNSPRHLAVLDLLAKKSGWGKRKPAKGHAFGLALHESFGSVVGQVVEISLEDSEISVHKVWCAVHCGQVVNPEGARAQVESALVYGISAALYGEVEIKEGVPQQSNFHDYRVMRLNEMPEVDVAFVKSSDPPTGLGEPGLPPIAPAIANAFYRLSKKRVRRLPMARSLGELA